MPDCAIIGGGPVGLIFAILSRTSIGNVQIFESKEHDSTNQDNRALALSNGSRLILEEIGVWDRLEKKITKIKKIHTSQAGSFGRTMLDSADFNEESLGYIISYGDLMAVLQKEVKCISNVDVSYETKVTKCLDKEASLNLTLQTKWKSLTACCSTRYSTKAKRAPRTSFIQEPRRTSRRSRQQTISSRNWVSRNSPFWERIMSIRARRIIFSKVI